MNYTQALSCVFPNANIQANMELLSIFLHLLPSDLNAFWKCTNICIICILRFVVLHNIQSVPFLSYPTTESHIQQAGDTDYTNVYPK